MFSGIKKSLSRWLPLADKATVMHAYEKYIRYSYPSNHTYKIVKGDLIPTAKLASRYKKIAKLLPNPLTSLVEIGSSKGFFVLSAAKHPTCVRSLGIDVNQYDIDVCEWLTQKLNVQKAKFAKMQLHELAENIQHFGGPFQVVLVLNTYQYLYFGSDNFPTCYLNHDSIFKCLRQICSGRVIFNNRIDLADCQNVKPIAQAGDTKRDYTYEHALQAASTYFTVSDVGKIGKYPLLTLDV